MGTNYNFKKLCMTLRQDDEFVEQMKEKFYQMKIQEAKELKEKEQQGNYMDLLPDDVQQHIMEIKYEKDKEYIEHIFCSRHITKKVMDLWVSTLFDKYLTIHHQRICIPSPKKDPEALMFAFINRLPLWKTLYGEDWKKCFGPRQLKKVKNSDKVWNEITKDDTPTMTSLIEFQREYNDEAKQQRELKKEIEQQQRIDQDSDYKHGDIIFFSGQYDYHSKQQTGFYIIESCTKTQYRVRKIRHQKHTIHHHQGHHTDLYTIPRTSSQRCEMDSKNISKKKTYYKMTDVRGSDTQYERYEENKTKWVQTNEWYTD
jgi:hypothetical protein